MFCIMATIAASEQVFSMAGHVVNSRRANLKSSSVNDISYLFDCKPQLIRFFHHFKQLIIQGGLHFFFSLPYQKV